MQREMLIAPAATQKKTTLDHSPETNPLFTAIIQLLTPPSSSSTEPQRLKTKSSAWQRAHTRLRFG
jgi:hypothetical protein